MRILNYLRSHKFETYLAAFLLIIIPPMAMYTAATNDNEFIFWISLVIVILGNLLALLV